MTRSEPLHFVAVKSECVVEIMWCYMLIIPYLLDARDS